jgi:hypothetical protein
MQKTIETAANIDKVAKAIGTRTPNQAVTYDTKKTNLMPHTKKRALQRI